MTNVRLLKIVHSSSYGSSSKDGRVFRDVQLPIDPFPGLQLAMPWRSNENGVDIFEATITEVVVTGSFSVECWTEPDRRLGEGTVLERIKQWEESGWTRG